MGAIIGHSMRDILDTYWAHSGAQNVAQNGAHDGPIMWPIIGLFMVPSWDPKMRLIMGPLLGPIMEPIMGHIMGPGLGNIMEPGMDP